MLYKLIKIPARIAFYFYCRRLKVNNPEAFKKKGPLLIAANHPNSFLDAIIIDTLFKAPVTALTRGDVFKNRFVSKILKGLHMLPVYRVSEGVENLEENYTTFNECNHIFQNMGIVLIFSEGQCTNEWHLRKLKKGTARLAISAWQNNIPLQVLPVGINYSSFRKFGKSIQLDFGEIIMREDIITPLHSGLAMIEFNSLLTKKLQKVVMEIPPLDKQLLKNEFQNREPAIKKLLLKGPAVLGYLLHFPFYYVASKFVTKKPNDHYDSILVGVLFFLYPISLFLIALITLYYLGSIWALLIIIIFLFTAWSLLQIKNDLPV